MFSELVFIVLVDINICQKLFFVSILKRPLKKTLVLIALHTGTYTEISVLDYNGSKVLTL